MVSRKLLFLTLLSLITFNNYAQLPFITDNAGTMGTWNPQLELSYGNGFDNGHRCTNNSVELAPVFTLGLTENIDAVVAYPFVFINEFEDTSSVRISGFSDVGMEIKWRFLEHEKFSLVFKPGISLPSGKSEIGLGNGAVGFSSFLISTMTYGKMAINTNLGYISNHNDCGAARNIWHTSVGFDFASTEIVHLVANGGIEKNPDINSQTPTAFALIGLYYFLSEYNEIALGYKCGLTEPEADHSFIVGLTLRF